MDKTRNAQELGMDLLIVYGEGPTNFIMEADNNTIDDFKIPSISVGYISRSKLIKIAGSLKYCPQSLSVHLNGIEGDKKKEKDAVELPSVYFDITQVPIDICIGVHLFLF